MDNSSAWRMSDAHKLVVPEVNGDVLTEGDLVIANPNCTTMQLVMALKPLHDKWQITRGVVNTYQSVTGTGQAAVAQLEAERRGEEGPGVYPHPIDQNCLPHCDTFQENGYTREEMKVHHETKKIMGDDSIQLSRTAVRVPVVGGHSEAVYLEFAKDFEMDAVRDALSSFPGVILEDRPEDLVYPMPRNAHGKDEVFVGRFAAIWAIRAACTFGLWRTTCGRGQRPTLSKSQSTSTARDAGLDSPRCGSMQTETF